MRPSYNKAGLETARQEFEQAIELDPRNARAYAGLADAIHFHTLYFSLGAGPPVTEECRRLAERAVELDPRLAEAHSTLGLLHYSNCEYAAAEKEMRIALSIDPASSYTRTRLASLLEEEARPDEALRELQLAKEVDPRSTEVSGQLVALLIWMDRLDEAKSELDRLAKIGPASRTLHLHLSDYYLARSDSAAALREVSEAESIPDALGSSGPSIQRAWIYACIGDVGHAKETLQALRDVPENFPLRVGRAAVFAVLGDLDECFRLLDDWLERTGGLALHEFRLNPRLEAVRRDARFARVLQRVKLS